MAKLKGPGPNTRKSMRTVSYGLAGNIAGTVVGLRTGHPTAGKRIGTGVGLAAGTALESHLTKRSARKRGQVPSKEKTTGYKDFQKRVGTKTHARVAKKDHPYNIGGRGH